MFNKACWSGYKGIAHAIVSPTCLHKFCTMIILVSWWMRSYISNEVADERDEDLYWEYFAHLIYYPYRNEDFNESTLLT